MGSVPGFDAHNWVRLRSYRRDLRAARQLYDVIVERDDWAREGQRAYQITGMFHCLACLDLPTEASERLLDKTYEKMYVLMMELEFGRATSSSASTPQEASS